MSLLREDKRHLAADLGFHGNFSFPNGYQRQTKLHILIHKNLNLDLGGTIQPTASLSNVITSQR